ncbi:TraG family protein [Candidatus Desulfofervidus auxilii]|uniref:TraG family protein n=1 Tax=Desulfofervidus auxilii TaxID=1621989 RepID=A0A7U4QJU4_DESA2|nr:TraM recognition domain-containing protein [Candidatus Desulfofervidus auxilii]AMM40667.1 TraG family protein [Candidatus Desulfofervidus auxilii]
MNYPSLTEGDFPAEKLNEEPKRTTITLLRHFSDIYTPSHPAKLLFMAKFKLPQIKTSRKVRRRYLNITVVFIFLLTLFTSFFPPVFSTPQRQFTGYSLSFLILLWNYRSELFRLILKVLNKNQSQEPDSTVKTQNKLLHIKRATISYEGPRPYLTLGFEEETGKEIIWPNEKEVAHMVMVGTTGSGKSSFLFNLLWQQMLRGGGAIFVDGGRNPQTLKNLVFMCEQARTLSRLRIVDPREPKTGHAYNPLSSGDADAITNKIMKVLNPIPAGSDAEYYKSKIYHATATLIRALTSIGKPFNIRDILCLYCLPEISFKILEEQLARYELSDALISLRTLIMETKTIRSFRDDLSNIIANLGSITTGEVGKSLCSPVTQVNLYDAVKKSQILYFMLPRMSDAEKATRLGRLLLGDIQTTIGLFYEEKEFKPIVPFLIILDEFGSYANPEFAVVFEQARKANFSVIAAIQSFGNLCNPYTGLSREFMQQVLGNSNTRMFLTVSDTETAELAARLVGRDITYFRSFSSSTQESEGADTISAKRFLNPVRTDRETVSEGYSERYDYRLRPEVFMHELGKIKGRAIVDFKDGNPIFARVCWLKPGVPPDYTYEEKIPHFAPGEAEPLSLWERVQVKLKYMNVSFEEEKKEKQPSCKLLVSARKIKGSTQYISLIVDGKEIVVNYSGKIHKRDEVIAAYRGIEYGLHAAQDKGYKVINVYSPIKTVIGQLGTGNVAEQSAEKPLFDRVKQLEKELTVTYHQPGPEETGLLDEYFPQSQTQEAGNRQAKAGQKPPAEQQKEMHPDNQESTSEQTEPWYSSLLEE